MALRVRAPVLLHVGQRGWCATARWPCSQGDYYLETAIMYEGRDKHECLCPDLVPASQASASGHEVCGARGSVGVTCPLLPGHLYGFEPA
jgi:hypothetical protein